MNSTTLRIVNRSRVTALVLVAGGVLGLLAACSSDGGNPSPSGPPVINTGGGGSGGKAPAGNEAGEDSGGTAQGGRPPGPQGGSSNSGDAGEGGGAGEGGEAGAPPVDPSCPTTDLGFLNQATTSQKSLFDNNKRLGAHTTLPALP
jgi:hypothetical protein